MGRSSSGFFRSSFLVVGLIVGLWGCSGDGSEPTRTTVEAAVPSTTVDSSSDSVPVSESEQGSVSTRTTVEAAVPSDAVDSSSGSVAAAVTTTTSPSLVATTSILSPVTTVPLPAEEGKPVEGLIAFLRADGLSGDELDQSQEVSDWSDPALALLAQQLFQFRCGFEIFVMNGDGSSVRQITENTTRVTAPVWSPDGSRFLYVDVGLLGFEEELCDQEGGVQRPPGVFVVDAETLTSRLATPAGLFVYNVLDVGAPVWSPDGSRFGFLGAIDNGDDVSDEGLYIVEADGSGLRLLVPIPGFAQWTDWSWAPDGSAIALDLLDPSGEDMEIFVVDIETAGIRRLTDNNLDDSFPVWSGDGSRIASLGNSYDLDDFTLVNEIYVTNNDGSGERRLTELGAFLYDLRWAPDGSGIYFRRQAQGDDVWSSLLVGNDDIFKVTIDGSSVSQVTDLRGLLAGLEDLEEEQRSVVELFTLSILSPDSSRVALTTSSDEALNADQPFPDSISIVDIGQLHNREIVARIGPIFDLAWSPDSSKLLVVSAADDQANFLTGNLEIYALDVTDGRIDRLTDYEGIDSRPAWAQPSE